MTWATVAEVLAVTGETVVAQDLAIASAMIDTKSGASEDQPADSISPRDRKTLERATCWQAVWVKAHPGLLTEYSASSSTGTQGTSDKRDSISAVLYGPMVLLELRNLSWAGTRSEYVPPRRVVPPLLDFLNEESDVYGIWRSIP